MTTAPPLKLRQLQYFLAVAELRHFTNAAERLHVTQPTLSHQIADLEQQLGTPLFDRVGKGVRLTEAGTLFRGFAEASLRQIESGRAALAELQGMDRGALRIGASQSFVRRLLPPLLGRFAQTHPGIALDVREMTALDIETGLSKGSLDVGIGYVPAILPETELEPLFEERLLLIVGHDHPMARRGHIPLADLDGLALALFTSTYTTRAVLDTLMAGVNAKPRVVAESNSVSVLIGMALTAGIGTIVLESALSHEEDFATVQLVNPTPTRTSALMWSHQTFRSAAARRFASMVKELFPLSVLPERTNGSVSQLTSRR